MHDNRLIALALCTAALGLVGLLFALAFLDITPTNDLATAADGMPVRLQGEVLRTRSTAYATLVTISSPATIDLVWQHNESLNLTPGTCVEVHGKKGSFEGKPQVAIAKLTTC